MRRLLISGMCALVGITPVAAQAPAASRTTRTVDRTTLPRILAGTRTTAFATILGNALDSANGPLPGSLVRLRDARVGRIAASQWTDKAGLFAFRMVDPGTYVVELLDASQAVVATSQLLTVGGDETASAVVRLPVRVPPFAGVLGQTGNQALAITAAAASAGVLTVIVARSVVSPE